MNTKISKPDTFLARVFYLLLHKKVECMVAEKNSQLSSSWEKERRTMYMLEDGSVEVAIYCYEVTWMPWPLLFINKKVIKSFTKEEFSSYIISKTVDKIAAVFLNEYQTNLKSKGEETLRSFFHSLLQIVLYTFKEEFARKRKNQPWKSAALILEELEIDILRNFKRAVSTAGSPKFKKMFNTISSDLVADIEKIINEKDSFFKIKESALKDVLPLNTRFYSRNAYKEVVVVEQSPMVRNLYVDPSISEEEKMSTFSLAFPFVIFVLQFNDGEFKKARLFYRNEPLHSLHDKLYISNLPNIDEKCVVCMGDSFPTLKSQEISGKVREIINYFWASNFNADYSEQFEAYGEQYEALNSFKKWQKVSKKNSNFSINIKWEKYRKLEDIISSALGKDYFTEEIKSELTKSIKKQLNETVEYHRAHTTEQIQKMLGEIKIPEKPIKAEAQTILQEQEKSICSLTQSLLTEILMKMSTDETYNSSEGILPNMITEALRETVSIDSAKLIDLSGQCLKTEMNTLINDLKYNS